MPPYLTSDVAWQALWPLPVAAVAATLLIACLLLLARAHSGALALLALSMLGITAGVLTGLSRDAAVGAVVPAVLSLVGGLALYLLGLKHGDARLVSGCVLALSLSLLTGTFWGAVMRNDAERAEVLWKDDQERAKTSLARRKQEALDELELREFRVALRLPPTLDAADKPDAVAADASSAAGKKRAKGK